MGGLIAGMVVLGLAAAATPPLGLMAVFIVLTGRNPTNNGLAFLAGWIGMLTALALLAAFVVNGRVRDDTIPSSVVETAYLVIGAALLLWAAYLARRNRHRGNPAEPKWLARLQRVGPLASFSAGALTPTYPAAIAAGADLVRAEVSSFDRFVALVVFIAVASVIVAAPVVFSVTHPELSRVTLERWRGVVIKHRSRIWFWTLFLLGGYLTVSGAVQLWLPN